MPLNEQIIRQKDWSAGELNPDARRRDDVDMFGFGLRAAENMAITHTGALIQRPGRQKIFRDTGRVTNFNPFNDLQYYVCFVDRGVNIRSLDGGLIKRLNAPWKAADLDELVWANSNNSIYVCWSGRTRIISVSETGKWSISSYTFLTDIEEALRVPFFRFVSSAGITMNVSGRTGNSIDVRFSSKFLTKDHEGTVMRYAGRQLKITRYLGPRHAKAKVLQELSKTVEYTLDSAEGFSVGQISETEQTGIKGEVIAVDSGANTVTVVHFDVLTAPVLPEKLVTVTASSTITSFNDTLNPGPTVQWDEQFISDYRGWPRSVSKDRGRLIFTNFTQLRNAICWSAIGAENDFLIGADPDDAMLETIDSECQVFHVVGGYDEFAITDKGVFFIPVSVGTPLQPGSVEFRRIVSNELGNVRPVEVTEGVIFSDKSGTGIYAITATGQQARPYDAIEINRLSRHLFTGIKSLAVSSGTKEFPARIIYAVNDDGTVVAGQFSLERNNVGWLKWSGIGDVSSIAAEFGQVIFMTVYDGSGVAEKIDYSLYLDCATTYTGNNNLDFIELHDGSPLLLNDGSRINLDGLITFFYADQLISVFGDGFYLGEKRVGPDGLINGVSQYAEVTVGFRFDWSFSPLFARFDSGAANQQGEKKRKISKMLATVRQTQEFKIGNKIVGGFRYGDPMDEPIRTRDAVYKYRETGRSYDPEVVFQSTFPGPFKLIELFTRITV
jgi:hypothetical protein